MSDIALLPKRANSGLSALQRSRILFNHLVGELLHRGRNSQSERFSGLEIDEKLKFRWVLYRQFARLSAPQYSIDVSCSLSELVDRIEPVRNQTASLGVKSEWIYRR